MVKCEDIISELQDSNKVFCQDYKDELPKHIKGQNPKVCVLTCSDSRVVPEFIFNKDIGEIFVVRVAGNVVLGPCIVSTLEYAVSHLNVELLIILGHTNCGAVNATEESDDDAIELFCEIKKGFTCDKNPIVGNIKYQMNHLPGRSKIISDAICSGKLCLKGAMYNLENGKVDFI